MSLGYFYKPSSIQDMVDYISKSYSATCFNVSKLPYGSNFDVIDAQDAVNIKLVAYGLKKESITIKVEGAVLSIISKESDDKFIPVLNYQFELDNVFDLDAIESNLENGILAIKLPKSEKAKPKVIVIK